MTGLKNFLNEAIPIVGFLMFIYHLVEIVFLKLDPLIHMNTHLYFALIIIFLIQIQKLDKYRPVAVVMLLASIIALTYVYVYQSDLLLRTGMPTFADVLIGIAIIIVLLEATRCTQGLGLPIFAFVFMLYVLLGHYLPSFMYHPPVSLDRAVSWFTIGLTTGVYSSIVYLSSTAIFMFILYGSVLEITGARDFFIQAGVFVAGKLKGGSAVIATVASSLVGSITGSPVANVALIGVITIPLMKRNGFKAHTAAAIEGLASSGGILLPPVMGSVAFIMSSITGIPYVEIMKIAVIPALLFYFSIFASAIFLARKENIAPAETKADTKLLMRTAPLFLLSFALIVTLLVLRYPAHYAASIAIIVTIILSLFRKETRPSLKQLIHGLSRGAVVASTVAVMCGTISLIVPSLSLTGLGEKLAFQVEILSFGLLPVALFFTMVISIIIGMASPVMGAYLLVALIVSPVLMRLGLSLEQAHFFALFFSVIGFITPPVAPSIIVAAQVAQAPVWGSAFTAMKIILPALVVPFFICYNSALVLRFDEGIFIGLTLIILSVLFVIAFAGLLQNYLFTKLSVLDKCLLLLALFSIAYSFFVSPNLIMIMLGIISFAVCVIHNFMVNRDMLANINVTSNNQNPVL